MKTFLPVAVVAGGLLGLVYLNESPASNKEIPAIDKAAPTKVKTATFALG